MTFLQDSSFVRNLALDMLIKNNYEEKSELIPKRIDTLTEAEVVAIINNTWNKWKTILKNSWCNGIEKCGE